MDGMEYGIQRKWNGDDCSDDGCNEMGSRRNLGRLLGLEHAGTSAATFKSSGLPAGI